jgi:hypothetical protein
MTERITHTGPLWCWTTPAAPAAWFFITLDGAAGAALAATTVMRRLEGLGPRGFGSVKVESQIGDSCWTTSAFPAKDVGGYMLPVKAAVRKAARIVAGDMVTVQLRF